MREVEEKIHYLSQWFEHNHQRGAQVVDSANRYAFICKALACVIEVQGLIVQELQLLNRRQVSGVIRLPGGRTIPGQVRTDE